MKDKQKINKCICMSGGGGNISCFVLGALLRLSEISNANSKEDKIDGRYTSFLEDVEVFSAVSGSTITMYMIELMIGVKNNSGLLKQSNWYKKHVMKPMHKFYKYNVFQKILIKLFNPRNWFRFQNLIDKIGLELMKQFDDFDRNQINKRTNTKHNFLYNYFDANTMKLACDHDDLTINTASKNTKMPFVKMPCVTRIARCILPYSNFNNIMAYDGGMIDNCGLSTVLDNYDPEELIVLTHQMNFVIDKCERVGMFRHFTNYVRSYRNNTCKTQLERILFSNIKKSNKKIGFICNTNCSNKFSHCITSKDKRDPILCTSKSIDNDHYNPLLWLGNGLFFCDMNVIKILENDGYCWMENYLRKNYPERYANNHIEYNPIHWNTTFDVPHKKYMDNDNNLKLYSGFYKKGAVYWFLKGLFCEFKMNLCIIFVFLWNIIANFMRSMKNTLSETCIQQRVNRLFI